MEQGPAPRAPPADDTQAPAEATSEDMYPTATSQELSKGKEHPAAEKSGEAGVIASGAGAIPVQTTEGAKAALDACPMEGHVAVESDVGDATGVTQTVGAIAELPSASVVPAAESDALSTVSTDDGKVERDFDDATARAKKELNLIQKMFKKIFKKKAKRKRSSRKKAAAAAKEKAAAEAKKEGGDKVGARAGGEEANVGARARGEEDFLVRIAREAEAELDAAEGGKASSSSDQRKPAADDRLAVQGEVAASSAMISQTTVTEVGAKDTK